MPVLLGAVMSDAQQEAVTFIRALVGAWDCCGTCAGGVLAKRDRQLKAAAWGEGYEAGWADESFDSRGLSTDPDADEHPHANPYRDQS